ncbi:MAG TPA: hypothetical protein PLU81_14870 [Deltaproteobacteria bacterium]|nr:hypothetical protein [Deltaproteobacteria bacterium]HPJ92838.1 hypothetical protein [Deltaproteobacteria bacterium]HPR53076.1 hypothetical protein [Deltaproteobacteria bacterium]
MKRSRNVLIVLFISALFISLPAGVLAESDETGFRGIGWGEDLSARQDMRRISCEKGFCSYVRDREELSMADAIITSVVYRAFNGRFVEAEIEAPVETRQGQSPGFESENFVSLKNICHELYGKTSFAVTLESVRAEQYRWEYTDIRKILRVNINKNTMQLTITDHALLDQLKEAPAGMQETLKDEQRDQEAGGENAKEPSPAPADMAADSTGTSSTEKEKKSTSKGFKKAAKVLRWLFVNDDAESGDEPPEVPR